MNFGEPSSKRSADTINNGSGLDISPGFGLYGQDGDNDTVVEAPGDIDDGGDKELTVDIETKDLRAMGLAAGGKLGTILSLDLHFCLQTELTHTFSSRHLQRPKSCINLELRSSPHHPRSHPRSG